MKLVTVVMPVFNGEAYLAEAIESILHQDLDDLELLVLDDGSTDRSVEIVQGYQDPRVRLLQSPQNLGVVATLNRGLDAARSVYVARMDADDISLPGRLSAQVALMEEDRAVGVCGSWVRFFGTLPDRVWECETEHEAIRSRHLFSPALSHPAVMLRKDVLDRFGLRYAPDFRYAQDYELWTRCAEHTRMANVPRVLLHYRWHTGMISTTKLEAQNACADRVRRREILALGIDPTPAEEALHCSLGYQKFRTDAGYLADVEGWLRRLAAENRRRRRFGEGTFERLLSGYFISVGHFTAGQGFWCGWRMFSSPLTDRAGLTPLERLALLPRGARAAARRRWRR
jgi:glycosyltransferase involved in cell wall biosynthesis